jgi:hypothetical protein
MRCDRFDLLRRARWSALLSVTATFAVLALILMARTTVTRYERRKEWPDNWALWFVMRGMQVVLALQVAGSLAGFGILLQSAVARTARVISTLAIPFVLLYLAERRLVLASVQLEQTARVPGERGSGTTPGRFAGIDAQP